MAKAGDRPGATTDLGAVQCALRAALLLHGHRLSGDTAGTQSSLYIMGGGDRAAALFEFKPTAEDAVYELMYQGAWVAGMPPRFVVLPRVAGHDDSLETLRQMKAIPLLFDAAGDTVAFADLDTLLSDAGLL